MNKRAHLWSLIGAQVLCTSLGLWIGQEYLTSEIPTALAGRLAEGAALDSAAAATAIRSSCLGIAAMTLIWTNGLLGVVAYMIVTRVHDEFSRREHEPVAEALRRSTDLMRTQEAVIFGLAKLADSRDANTGEHLERISLYSTTLASALQKRGLFRDLVTLPFVHSIGASSALHDIGKVGVEDSILRKAGPLTPQEFLRIQSHIEIGEECLKEIERRLGASNFLEMAREIVTAHHERWDGTGYPAGLKGEEIPLSARIVALADVYDALSNKRAYKDALTHAECVDYIRGESGKHFDPRLADVFLEIEPLFDEIARRFAAPAASTAEEILECIDQTMSIIASEQVPTVLEREVAT